MRQVVFDNLGKSSSWNFVTIEQTQMGAQEVTINVKTVGVNRADLLQRLGLYPPPSGYNPNVPGLEFAGEVVAVGNRCQRWKPGDRVMGLVSGEAYADTLVVHELELLSVPENLDWNQAAATPEAFMTAFQAIFQLGRLQQGDSCLIRAAASGVGMAACQLAQSLGVNYLGTGRNVDKLRKLRAMGLDSVVQDSPDLMKTCREHTAGHGVDLVMDLLGGGHLKENLSCLADRGRLVLIGLLGGVKDSIDLSKLLMRRQTIQAMTMRSLPISEKILLVQAFEKRVMPKLRNGELSPVIDTVYPIAKLDDAHRKMSDNKHFGKLILQWEDLAE